VPPGKQGGLYSQCGQDWLVGSLLGCKRDGFFVDLAANDAKVLSNTLALERDFGWRGICIEPNPRYQEGLLKRTCQVVGTPVASPANTPVTFDFEGVVGGIVNNAYDNKLVRAGTQTRQFKTVSLAEVLAATNNTPSVIDFLSLDVEGAESDVMRDFPWDKYTFLVIAVERPKPDLAAMLGKAGYTKLRENAHFDDQTWVHNSLIGKVRDEFGHDCWTELPAQTCMAASGHKKPPPSAYVPDCCTNCKGTDTCASSKFTQSGADGGHGTSHNQTELGPISCNKLQEKYGVVAGISWGSLPKELQREWTERNCDVHVTPTDRSKK